MKALVLESARLLLAVLAFTGFALATADSAIADAQKTSLSFEQRVEAMRAIESVYNRHRDFARPLDEVLPRAALETRVRTYLKQSAALREIWRQPITTRALDDEVRRIVASSRMPARLHEVFAALGNDPRLLRECLARPLLAERLARQMFSEGAQLSGESSWSAFWSRVESGLPEEPVDGEVAVDSQEGGRFVEPASSVSPTCYPDDTWTAMALPQATIPGFESDHAIWTGNELLAFKGSSQATQGGIYEPATDSWTGLTVPPFGSIPQGAQAVWIGNEVIFWGGYVPLAANQPTDYVRYNPFAGTWATIPSGSSDGLLDHSVVYTGTELIVWGGNSYRYTTTPIVTTLASGVRYNPSTGARIPFGPLGQPPRAAHSAVWTGSVMLLFGGSQVYRPPALPSSWYDLSIDVTTSAYDPQTGAFTLLNSSNPSGAPFKRHRHSAVWTGDSMIIWGGEWSWVDFPRFPNILNRNPWGDGAIYHPQTNTWSSVSLVSGASPSARQGHTAVWTGTDMFIWNGPSDRARYSPATNTWTRLASTGAPCLATPTAAAWTGSDLLAWGCPDNSGARYALNNHADLDDDGITVCQGDCSDLNANVYPGAPEICDLLDDDCDGVVPAGETDGDSDGYRACDLDCDDANPVIHAGAPELCDRLDNNCDNIVPVGELDLDQDGYMACDLDCNDLDASIHPGATEACDGIDNDCDSLRDDGFPDSDQDSHADCVDCAPQDGSVWAAPLEVSNVQAMDQWFVWDDLSHQAGDFITYDVFNGSLAALRQGGGSYATGACYLTGWQNYGVEFPEVPPAGDGYYVMVRGTNACGVGTYGSPQRDQTAGASPLACP